MPFRKKNVRLCQTRPLVAKFKEAGDWCKEHNRPESQCYLCYTSLRFHKFAARYEARFRAKPSKPTK